MKITKSDSQKLTILSFVLIMSVLYIHGYYVEAENFPFALAFQQLTGTKGMSVAAVPLFYAISGLLFFKDVESIKDCFPKMRNRIRTLLIPYIIWNLVFIGWYVMLEYTPGVTSFVNSDMLSSIQWQHPLATFQFIFIEPAGFQLWFLRDLILYVVVSPLLYFVIKKQYWITLIVLYLALGWIPRCGVIYFALGGVVSMHYCLEKVKQLLTKPVVGLCLLLYLLNCARAAHLYAFPFEMGVYYPYYEQVVSVIGIIVFWRLYDFIVPAGFTLSPWASRIVGYTFFIYLFHEPTLNIIKKLGVKVLGCSDVTLILLYLVNTFVMMAIAIVAGTILKKFVPKFYTLCVGGR